MGGRTSQHSSPSDRKANNKTDLPWQPSCQPTHLETFAYFCDQSRLYAQSTHIETKLQRWHLCTFTLFHPSEQIMFHKFLQCLAVQVTRPRAACRTVREKMPAAAPRTPRAVWAKDLLKAPAICHSRHVDMICRDSWFKMCLNMFDWISCILLLMHTHIYIYIYILILILYNTLYTCSICIRILLGIVPSAEHLGQSLSWDFAHDLSEATRSWRFVAPAFCQEAIGSYLLVPSVE